MGRGLYAPPFEARVPLTQSLAPRYRPKARPSRPSATGDRTQPASAHQDLNTIPTAAVAGLLVPTTKPSCKNTTTDRPRPKMMPPTLPDPKMDWKAGCRPTAVTPPLRPDRRTGPGSSRSRRSPGRWLEGVLCVHDDSAGEQLGLALTADAGPAVVVDGNPQCFRGLEHRLTRGHHGQTSPSEQT